MAQRHGRTHSTTEVGAVGRAFAVILTTRCSTLGVVLGVGASPHHAFRGLPAEAPGVYRQLQVTRNYSAVPAPAFSLGAMFLTKWAASMKNGCRSRSTTSIFA